MGRAQFCGQTCTDDAPDARLRGPPHARVQCVECHVGEGGLGRASPARAARRGSSSTPTAADPSAIETDKLIPPATCERCHWPEKFVSARLKVIPVRQDEANTPSQTVLMTWSGSLARHPRLHWPGVEIRFAAADKKRQKTPWVEYRNTRKGETRSYLAKDATAGVENGLPRFTMQCVDCHNRPTHAFELPDRAMDRAMTVGLLPSTLPFLKKKGVELLKATYASNDEAGRRIPAEPRLLPADLPEGGVRTRGGRGRGREDALPNLRQQRLPGPGSHLGSVPEQPRPRRVSRLLPLSRRRAQDRRRKDHHPGLQRLPRSRGHGGELSGVAQDPGARREDRLKP